MYKRTRFQGVPPWELPQDLVIYKCTGPIHSYPGANAPMGLQVGPAWHYRLYIATFSLHIKPLGICGLVCLWGPGTSLPYKDDCV